MNSNPLDPVYVVLRNGAVDEVFDNVSAAELHKANLLKKWNLVEIVQKVLKTW
jgi:hypothetical protein